MLLVTAKRSYRPIAAALTGGAVACWSEQPAQSRDFNAPSGV